MTSVQMSLPFYSRDLADIDTILGRAIAAGDPLIASEYGNSISKAITLRGVALAKLFFGMRDNWELFRTSGIEEDFPDFVDAHMLVKGKTAIKYANMYEAVFVTANISPAIRKQLFYKPVESLLLLTAAVREGSLDDEQLADVVILDHKGVRDVVRKSRGDATSSKTHIYARLVQREHTVYRKGTIVAFDGEGHSEAVGYLLLEAHTEHGRKYVERAKNILGLEDIR